ncbi:DUF368 domain-containing protein [Flavobacteriaceae bacterium Ap0902]|nr:DUF368 domain-containing protein [Flavobacteriaceae bacterium Ap0902]
MHTTKDYLMIFLKGLSMGAADVVPGVSGGTIAFITGIYAELLDSISSIKPSLIQDFKKEGIKEVWRKINGNFLVALLSGIAVSILSLAKILSYAMHYYPIQLWCFFFGLILASIWYVGKQINRWNISSFLGLILGTALVFWLSVTPPLGSNSSYLFLFLAGSIASCAMILPGISGSFILLLLGAYSTIITAVGNRDLMIIGTVGFGAVVGLLSFSKLLKYLLKNYPNTLIATLTGFLIGSLWKIWPWKTDELVYIKDVGVQPAESILEGYQSLSAFVKNAPTETFENIKPYVEHNILPSTYALINHNVDANLLYGIIFGLLGFSIIFIIEFVAKSKNV